MDHLTDLSCKDFAKVLASRLPVPGGGGAAAMAGTLAAALCAMVGNFTSGKKKYAALEGELQQSIARCDALRLRLLELVELDVCRPMADKIAAAVTAHVRKEG